VTCTVWLLPESVALDQVVDEDELLLELLMLLPEPVEQVT